MSQKTKNQKPKTSIDFANLQHQHNLYKEEIEKQKTFLNQIEEKIKEIGGSNYSLSQQLSLPA